MEFNELYIGKIGLISDTQYADEDIGTNFNKTETRQFRETLNAVSTMIKNEYIVIMQCGDIIDGRNKDTGNSIKALETTLEVFKDKEIKRIDAVGNHELQNLSREQCSEMLNCTKTKVEALGFEDASVQPGEEILIGMNGSLYIEGKEYKEKLQFAFKPVDGFSFIMLDSQEISLLGQNKSSVEYKAAEKVVNQNPNQVNGNKDWLEGITGVDRRWVPFNGGISVEQLWFLEESLKAARERADKVVVFAHVPVHPDACTFECLLFNQTDVLDLLHKQEVKLFVAGHDHIGGYTLDDNSTHHLTLKAPLIHPENCFSELLLFKNEIQVKGNAGPEFVVTQ